VPPEVEQDIESTPAQDLANEIVQREIGLDVVLDAVGLLLDSDPAAPAIISAWMMRMMNGSAPIPGQFGGVSETIADSIKIPGT